MTSNIVIRQEKSSALSFFEGDTNLDQISKLFRFSEDAPVSTGSDNAYSIMGLFTPAVATLENNSFFGFTPNFTNTAANPTLQVDSSGAFPIKNVGGEDIAANTILATDDQFYVVRWNADTSEFWLVDPPRTIALKSPNDYYEYSFSSEPFATNVTFADGEIPIPQNPNPLISFTLTKPARVLVKFSINCQILRLNAGEPPQSPTIRILLDNNNTPDNTLFIKPTISLGLPAVTARTNGQSSQYKSIITPSLSAGDHTLSVLARCNSPASPTLGILNFILGAKILEG